MSNIRIYADTMGANSLAICFQASAVKSSQASFISTQQNKTKPQACLSQVSRIHSSLQQEPPQTQFWTLSNIWQNILLSFLILYKFKRGSNDVPAACLIDQHVRLMVRLLRASPPLPPSMFGPWMFCELLGCQWRLFLFFVFCFGGGEKGGSSAELLRRAATSRASIFGSEEIAIVASCQSAAQAWPRPQASPSCRQLYLH